MSLQDLWAKHHDRVEFLMLYIREAHPVDGWWLGKGLPGLVLKISKRGIACVLEENLV